MKTSARLERASARAAYRQWFKRNIRICELASSLWLMDRGKRVGGGLREQISNMHRRRKERELRKQQQAKKRQQPQ
jgi:hypothetical protein